MGAGTGRAMGDGAGPVGGVDARAIEASPASAGGASQIGATRAWPLPGEACDVCNARALVERKCKVICTNCHSIVRSCADL